MPAELKPFEEALRKSGMDDNHDMDQLAFVLFRPQGSGGQLATLGIAQGQFAVQDIFASFRKQKLKLTLVRANRVYPLVKTGMVACFVDPSTMVFGTPDAVPRGSRRARRRSGQHVDEPPTMIEAMKSVDYGAAVECP